MPAGDDLGTAARRWVIKGGLVRATVLKAASSSARAVLGAFGAAGYPSASRPRASSASPQGRG
jgi:hypothetical protein